MNKFNIIIGISKKDYVINIKYLNNYITNNFTVIIAVILASYTKRVERKFV